MSGLRDTARRLFASVTLATTAFVLVCGPARAQVREGGKWRQGPLREDFTVQKWTTACGPEPRSSSTGGGEIISIRPEGDELSFIGGGRVYRTNQCYDPMPSLSRETHSRDPNGKTWRTRCTTPPNDPRRAILNTLVIATTDSRIDVVETGRYEVVLQSGTCMADVKRTRSFVLVEDESPAAPVPAAPPKAAEPHPREPKPGACATPGEPTRLEVRPSKKLLRTGESFQFQSVVVDRAGCPTRTATTWQLAPGAEGKGVTVDARGRVTIADDAPEGEVEIVATAAGKSTRVGVEVSEPSHYDELLARSGLNASGEDDAASTVAIGSESIGAGEGKVEDRARTRRLMFVAIVGASLILLGAIAALLLRRSRRAAALEREAEERHEARVKEVLSRRQQRADEHAAQQRAHEASLAAASAASLAEEPAAGSVCPSCGRSFAPPTTFCAHDGTQLVPASRAGAAALVPGVLAQRAGPPKRGKICPTCGERFDGGADYCGKDGTQLVLLN
jgi:hypothetical protein